MKRTTILDICTLMALFASGMSCMSIRAQAPGKQSEPLPPELLRPLPSENTPIEEKKIDQFAAAYIAVEQIQTLAAEELSTISDPRVASKVKANAEGWIIEAVLVELARVSEAT